MRRIILAVLLLAVIAAPSSAADTVRIGIMNFENRANGLSNAHVRAITDVFTRMLANSPSVSVIEQDRLDAIARQQKMSMSGMIDPRMLVEVGRIAGCQYVLVGAATKFNKTSKSTGFKGIFAEIKTEANITLDARLIDTKTGEVVLSASETGSATHKQSASSLGGVTQTQDVAGGLEDSAIEEAVSRISQRVLEAAVGDYMQVLGIDGRDIMLSIGAISGARNGALFRVNAEGGEIMDMRGNVIGRRSKAVAIVQIVEVDNEFSIARVIKDGGNASLIRRGDKIRAVSNGEAQSLIKNKELASSRPRSFGDASDNDTKDYPAADAPEPVKPERRTSGSLENESTNPEKVIPTYGLADGETKARIQLHKNLQKSGKTRNVYNRYVELVRTHEGDYLAAYQAGMTALALGMKQDAMQWFDKALEVNPNYVPAQQAKENPNAAASGRRRKRK
ncbi:MAG: hypothetical protein IJS28_05835 [Synergistaceae bacterium]|nr:hypothetical protein [Synergistaceae bacterium]